MVIYRGYVDALYTKPLTECIRGLAQSIHATKEGLTYPDFCHKLAGGTFD